MGGLLSKGDRVRPEGLSALQLQLKVSLGQARHKDVQHLLSTRAIVGKEEDVIGPDHVGDGVFVGHFEVHLVPKSVAQPKLPPIRFSWL